MSELLQRYREKAEILQQVIEGYKTLSGALISQVRGHVKENETLDKAMDVLLQRIKGANNLFQIQQINKEYAALIKHVDYFIREKGGAKGAPGGAGGGGFLSSLGSLFSKGEQGATGGQSAMAGDVEEMTRELMTPYMALIDCFSKGVLVLADEKEPFYETLSTLRDRKYADLRSPDVESLSHSLYNFFINKSNESVVVGREREELKKVISALTNQLKSLAISSETFGVKLESYSRQVAAAESIDEIKKIQRAIISETMSIQKENAATRVRLADSEKKLLESAERIAKLEVELEMARSARFVDHLTKVYNRAYFDEKLKEAAGAYSRYQEPFCLIMFDIDHFKKFNDTYGHQVGDKVLATVAAVGKETVRAADTVARYGGEEFAVIAYKTALDAGVKAADNIREALHAHEFVLKSEGQAKTISVTASFGVAEFKPGDSPESLIQKADKGLYEAKRQGRNRVVTLQDS
ncbi:MAG: GGDEF domain-containing protein [Nitrospinae bacterium]|nr:GGDEF domain-containing protein [Nitrospinota bacterium]